MPDDPTGYVDPDPDQPPTCDDDETDGVDDQADDDQADDR